MPGRFALKPTWLKIWHAPDNIRIMDPLPPMHRRGVIAGMLLVIIGILLPSDENAPASLQANQNAQPDQQSQPQQGELQPLPSVSSSPPVNDPDQIAPVSPEVVQENPPDAQPTRSDAQTQTSSQQTASGIEQQWRSYRIESGKTLAQLFRDHSLPVTDAYAMSKVEGAGKPLSSLQAGQIVKIRQNVNAVVTGLTLEGENGQQLLFTRQSDGSFIRAR